MSTAPPETRWFRSQRLVDMASLGIAILTGAVSRQPVRPRGDEALRPLPGDELLPAAGGQWTHGITIRARPGDIWPWLIQMGCRRAGWYSYDAIDNGGVPSASSIVPALQHARVGDLFPWTPEAQDGFTVAAVDPPRALVLRGTAGSLYEVTWAFALVPIDGERTRLVTRSRGAYRRRSTGLWLGAVVHPIHFGMQRKQLLTLRRRIEGALEQTCPASAAVDCGPALR